MERRALKRKVGGALEPRNADGLYAGKGEETDSVCPEASDRNAALLTFDFKPVETRLGLSTSRT